MKIDFKRYFNRIIFATIIAVVFCFLGAPFATYAMHDDMGGCGDSCSEQNSMASSDCLEHCIDSFDDNHLVTSKNTVEHSFTLPENKKIKHNNYNADSGKRFEKNRIPWIYSYILKTQKRE